jgi:hypothetical protein
MKKGGELLMPTHRKTVTVLPDSELSLIAQTEPAGNVFAHYDPQAAIAGLRALDEAFAGVDRDQLLRDVHAQRAQVSQGRPA